MKCPDCRFENPDTHKFCGQCGHALAIAVKTSQKESESYDGRNPKTGDTVQVAPKRLPFFKVGKELNERVDY